MGQIAELATEALGRIDGEEAAYAINRSKIIVLHRQDGGAPSKEEQMLLEIPGVSVDAKPRKDGRWQGRYTVDGKKQSVYARTKEEVIKRLQAIVTGKAPAKKKRVDAYKLHDWLDKWLELYKPEDAVKPKTREKLKYCIARSKELLPNKDLKEITGIMIQESFLTIAGMRMRQMIFMYLNAALVKAVKLGLLKVNPCAAAELPPPKKKKKRAFTRDEQQRILEDLKGHRLEGFFHLLLTTGLRVGEALALKSSDISGDMLTVDKNVVFIRGKRILQDSTKTDAGERTIPIPRYVIELLAPFMRNDELFADLTYNAVKLVVDRMKVRLELKNCSLHTFRHTYATRLDEAGIPPKIKQYLLGHASLDMTQNVYTDVQREHILSQKESIIGAFDTRFDTQN